MAYQVPLTCSRLSLMWPPLVSFSLPLHRNSLFLIWSLMMWLRSWCLFRWIHLVIFYHHHQRDYLFTYLWSIVMRVQTNDLPHFTLKSMGVPQVRSRVLKAWSITITTTIHPHQCRVPFPPRLTSLLCLRGTPKTWSGVNSSQRLQQCYTHTRWSTHCADASNQDHASQLCYELY